jgi:phage terminase small subunit
MEKKLTPKQKLFVERYLVHKNGLRAAEEAGYKGNYSTLGSIAVENLNKPAIKAAVDAEMAVVTKRNQLDQDWVLKRLMAIAGFQVTDVAELRNGSIKLKDQDDVDELGYLGVHSIAKSTSEGDTGSSRSVSITSKNQLKALELLGKHLKMWDENAGRGAEKDDSETVKGRVAGFLGRLKS